MSKDKSDTIWTSLLFAGITSAILALIIVSFIFKVIILYFIAFLGAYFLALFYAIYQMKPFGLNKYEKRIYPFLTYVLMLELMLSFLLFVFDLINYLTCGNNALTNFLSVVILSILAIKAGGIIPVEQEIIISTLFFVQAGLVGASAIFSYLNLGFPLQIDAVLQGVIVSGLLFQSGILGVSTCRG